MQSYTATSFSGNAYNHAYCTSPSSCPPAYYEAAVQNSIPSDKQQFQNSAVVTTIGTTAIAAGRGAASSAASSAAGGAVANSQVVTSTEMQIDLDALYLNLRKYSAANELESPLQYFVRNFGRNGPTPTESISSFFLKGCKDAVSDYGSRKIMAIHEILEIIKAVPFSTANIYGVLVLLDKAFYTCDIFEEIRNETRGARMELFSIFFNKWNPEYALDPHDAVRLFPVLGWIVHFKDYDDKILSQVGALLDQALYAPKQGEITEIHPLNSISLVKGITNLMPIVVNPKVKNDVLMIATRGIETALVTEYPRQVVRGKRLLENAISIIREHCNSLEPSWVERFQGAVRAFIEKFKVQ